MPIVRQTSFSGGELSPTMYGRTDLAQYRIGTRQLLNFLPSPFGSLQNRPGTQHLGNLTVPFVSDGAGGYVSVGSGGECVGVGDGSAKALSADFGENWTTATTLPTGNYYGCAYGAGHVVGVGTGLGGTGAVLSTSDDLGDTWTARTPVGVNPFYAVAYDPTRKRFWAGGAARLFIEYSDDYGVTWDHIHFPVAVTTATVHGIAVHPTTGQIVVIGEFYTGTWYLSLTSSDGGVNWTLGGSGRNMTWGGICWDGTYWISVGNHSTVTYLQRSTDGINWSILTPPTGDWRAICSSTDRVVMVGPGGTNWAAYSTDHASSWSIGDLPTGAWYSICWNGYYFITIDGAKARTSPTGSTWTARTMPATSMRGVCCAPIVTAPQARRLIPVSFPDQDLVCEFGDGVVRFWEDGEQVLSGSSPYQVTLPYEIADLPYLKWSQRGNQIILACRGYAPRQLERTSAVPLQFTLTTLTFDAPDCAIPLFYNTVGGNWLLASYGEYMRWASVVYDASITPTQPLHWYSWKVSAICQSLDGSRTWETKAGLVAPRCNTADAAWNPATTYAFGAVVKYEQTNGVLVSYSSAAGSNLNNAPATGTVYNDPWWIPVSMATFHLSLTEHLPEIRWMAPTATTYRVIGWRVYRLQGGVDVELGMAGLIADLPATTSVFCDDGSMDPDFTQQPIKGQNPFDVRAYDGTLLRTEVPTTVTHHDERLVFGGTEERPDYVFASRLGDWCNFDEYPILKADDAITFGLACRRYEEIRSLMSGRSLLTFTTGSEWSIDGGQPEAPIVPTSITARVRSERGSTWLDPLKVGDDHALFVQRKGTLIQDMRFDGQAGTYVNADLSLFARHLFRGHEILDWCWAEDPDSIVWVVRDDGVLLSLTFVPSSGIIAWARHELGGSGKVESICAVSEGEEDVIYMVVRRGTVWTIERLTTRQITVAEDGCFLDNSLSFEFTSPTTAITGLTHLNGSVVYALADGIVRGPFTVAGGAITLPVAASTVHVGLQYNADFESLDAPPGEGKARMRTVKTGWLELEASAGTVKVGPDFSHLETWSGKEADESAAVSGLVTGQAQVNTVSRWNHGGRVVVRQSDPLPVTILSVSREVEYGNQ